jgi:hypothetical protein
MSTPTVDEISRVRLADMLASSRSEGYYCDELRGVCVIIRNELKAGYPLTYSRSDGFPSPTVRRLRTVKWRVLTQGFVSSGKMHVSPDEPSPNHSEMCAKVIPMRNVY